MVAGADLDYAPAMRIAPLTVLLSLFTSAAASAHTGAAMNQLQPGEPFPVAEMRAFVLGDDGHYKRQVIDFNKLRDGSTLVFLAIDPVVKTDLGEARRFLALTKTLHNTHAFFVLPPARSMRPDDLLPIIDKAKVELPFLIDDRDYFPFAFQYGLAETPRYEVFDNTQTLVIRGASQLSQRMPSGQTLTESLRTLDQGKLIPQATFAARKGNIVPDERP
jgi:hypothetical protein